MVQIDENQEAIALIRMAIDNDKKAQTLQDQVDMGNNTEDYRSHGLDLYQHWTFGSPSGTQLESQVLEEKFASTNHDFFSFNDRLRSFLTHWFPGNAPHYEDLIYVCSAQAICQLSLTNSILAGTVL